MQPTLIAYLQETALGMFSSLTDALSFSLKFVVNFFFMLLFLFFLFENGPRVGESVYHLLPFPND
jgi:predicted PurR-regulated permease PerM